MPIYLYVFKCLFPWFVCCLSVCLLPAACLSFVCCMPRQSAMCYLFACSLCYFSVFWLPANCCLSTPCCLFVCLLVCRMSSVCLPSVFCLLSSFCLPAIWYMSLMHVYLLSAYPLSVRLPFSWSMSVCSLSAIFLPTMCSVLHARLPSAVYLHFVSSLSTSSAVYCLSVCCLYTPCRLYIFLLYICCLTDVYLSVVPAVCLLSAIFC